MIRRKRVKIRESTKRKDVLCLKGLYFDDRKHKTINYDGGRRKIVTEEHIVLIAEPRGIYLGHVSPKIGTAAAIVKSILQYLETDETIDTSSLRVIGCDGTNVNTGRIIINK
jgi:hypothetical protein